MERQERKQREEEHRQEIYTNRFLARRVSAEYPISPNDTKRKTCEVNQPVHLLTANFQKPFMHGTLVEIHDLDVMTEEYEIFESDEEYLGKENLRYLISFDNKDHERAAMAEDPIGIQCPDPFNNPEWFEMEDGRHFLRLRRYSILPDGQCKRENHTYYDDYKKQLRRQARIDRNETGPANSRRARFARFAFGHVEGWRAAEVNAALTCGECVAGQSQERQGAAAVAAASPLLAAIKASDCAPPAEDDAVVKPAAAAEAVVEKLLASMADGSLPVLLFSKTYCPYCTRTKALLRTLCDFEAAVTVLELDTAADGSLMQAHLVKRTGQSTVPQAFIGGQFMGGYDSLSGLDPENVATLIAR